MHILFWFRKPAGCGTAQPTTVGKICLRLTVDGVCRNRVLRHAVARADWNDETKRVRGRSDAARLINADLIKLEAKVETIYARLEHAGTYVTAAGLLRALDGSDEAVPETLADAWAHLSAHQAARAAVGEIAPSTAYGTAHRWPLVARYLAHTKRPDLLVSEIRPAWGRAFYNWMRYEQKHEPAYARHVLNAAARVIGAALERMGHTGANPLRGLSLPKAPEKQVPYLTADELARLQAAPLPATLRLHADVFIFQCLTGLAWVDVHRFRASTHVERDERGREWLDMDRSKTSTTTGLRACPPLLPEARALLDAYGGERLPVACNQVLNRYLKKALREAGIDKSLASHSGRHTFLELMIERGVSFEAAAAMAGHTSEKMTRRYAKIRRQRVATELERVGVL